MRRRGAPKSSAMFTTITPAAQALSLGSRSAGPPHLAFITDSGMRPTVLPSHPGERRSTRALEMAPANARPAKSRRARRLHSNVIRWQVDKLPRHAPHGVQRAPRRSFYETRSP